MPENLQCRVLEHYHFTNNARSRTLNPGLWKEGYRHESTRNFPKTIARNSEVSLVPTGIISHEWKKNYSGISHSVYYCLHRQNVTYNYTVIHCKYTDGCLFRFFNNRFKDFLILKLFCRLKMFFLPKIVSQIFRYHFSGFLLIKRYINFPRNFMNFSEIQKLSIILVVTKLRTKPIFDTNFERNS